VCACVAARVGRQRALPLRPLRAAELAAAASGVRVGKTFIPRSGIFEIVLSLSTTEDLSRVRHFPGSGRVLPAGAPLSSQPAGCTARRACLESSAPRCGCCGVGGAVPCTAERNTYLGVGTSRSHASHRRQMGSSVPQNYLFGSKGFTECMPRTQYSNRMKRFFEISRKNTQVHVFSFPVQIMYLQDGRRCPCRIGSVGWEAQAMGKRVDDA